MASGKGDKTMISCVRMIQQPHSLQSEDVNAAEWKICPDLHTGKMSTLLSSMCPQILLKIELHTQHQQAMGKYSSA